MGGFERCLADCISETCQKLTVENQEEGNTKDDFRDSHLTTEWKEVLEKKKNGGTGLEKKIK